MASKCWRVLLGCLWVGLMALPAWGETDYKCLKSCAEAGVGYLACKPRCSFDTVASPAEENAHMEPACFKKCVAAGGGPAVCVVQCTQTSPRPVQRPAATINPLDAPIPLDGVIIPPAPKPKPRIVTDVDPQCVVLCAKGGLQYSLCEQRCGK